MTDIDLWRRARKVFDEIVLHPEGERESALERECGEDRELRSAVHRLLEEDASVEQDALESQFERFLASEDEVDSWVGSKIGSYRIVRELGRGGMGEVYLAEREGDDFEQRVAIKRVRADRLGAELKSRFRRERRLLAQLDHPNIARLLDGGSSPDGSPYLVMEFVEGQEILEYADRLRLTVRRRVELFCQVCSAVHFAHRNLVVHRDLKGSNVLVGDDGTAKLLDFGIAKLLDPSEAEGPLDQTQGGPTQTRVFTRDYASPEQLMGERVTTASDVYSLGVVLFELLSGVRPAPLRVGETRSGQSTLKMAVKGAKEAAKGLADQRGTHPAGLVRELGGDLTQILAKALALDPEARYGTAGELGEDLENYLQGYPVRARPPAMRYRLGKLISRNRLASAVIVSALLGLSVATAWALAERKTAVMQGDRAQALNQLLIEAFGEVDPERSRGRVVSVREVLSNRTRRLDSELNEQPGLKAAMMHTIGEIYVKLGLFEEADELLTRAVEVRSDGTSAIETAESLAVLTELRLLERRGSEAARLAQRAREIFLAHEDPRAADVLHDLAEVEWQEDRREEAIELHRQALADRAALDGETSGEYVEGLVDLAVALRSTARYGESEAAFLRAIEIQRRLDRGDHPRLARLLSELASLMEAWEKLSEGRAYAEQAVAMNRRLYGDSHPALAANFNTLGNIEQMSGDHAAAANFYARSAALNRELYSPEHPRHAKSYYNLAMLTHRELGRPDEALVLYENAVASARVSLSPGHTTLGFFLVGLGDCLVELDRAGASLAGLEEALEIFRAGSSERNLALGKSALGSAYLELGRVNEARPLIEESVRVLGDYYPPEHRIFRRAASRLERLQSLL